MKVRSCIWSWGLCVAGAAVLAADPVENRVELPVASRVELPVASRVELLEQQIRALEARLDAMNQVQERISHAVAPTTERRQVEPPVRVSAGKKGVSVESGDGSYRFGVGLLLQTDIRFYLNGKSSDTLTMRRIEPIFRGTLWQDMDFQVMPEFAGSARILDAYGDYRINDALRVRFGAFKSPLGLEYLQSSASQRFLENGYVSQLLPSRDLGIQLHGNFWQQKLAWKLGVFNGAADGAGASTNTNSNFDVAGSLWVRPFRDSEADFWKGLGVGIAASWGSQKRAANLSIRNQGDTSLISGNEINEKGDSWRINPQLSYYNGPLGIMTEYILSSRVLGDSTRPFQRYHNEAWTVSVGYVLTGENNSYGNVIPSRPFRPGFDGMGAWEVVLRYTSLGMDSDLWKNRLLNLQQPDRANGWSVAVNWYATENWKAILSYDYTDYRGGKSGGGDRNADQAILSRLQIDF